VKHSAYHFIVINRPVRELQGVKCRQHAGRLVALVKAFLTVDAARAATNEVNRRAQARLGVPIDTDRVLDTEIVKVAAEHLPDFLIAQGLPRDAIAAVVVDEDEKAVALPLCGANASDIDMGCGQPILDVDHLYRCTDCNAPFHRACAEHHFDKSKARLA